MLPGATINTRVQKIALERNSRPSRIQVITCDLPGAPTTGFSESDHSATTGHMSKCEILGGEGGGGTRMCRPGT